MAYYSLVVKSPRPQGITDLRRGLDEGINAFSTLWTGSQEELVQTLKTAGVEIVQLNRLDQLEECSAQDMLLPGESPEKLLGQ
jgi:hypothetical protein